MQIKTWATILAAGLLGSACTMATGAGDDTTGDDSTSDGGGGGGGGGGTNARWAAMPLVDDTSVPGDTVYHQGNDVVTGIYFTTPTTGVITSTGANQTSADGGAVFEASGTAVTSVAFSGNGTGLSLVGAVDFTGIEKTPNGFIAMAHANDAVTSTDGGHTFSIQKNGRNQMGIEPMLAYRQTATGATLVRSSGVVTVTTGSAPGPDVVFQDVWAPEANPPIPAVVPVTQCQARPSGSNNPVTRDAVFVSADRNFIAYTANPDEEPMICISTDGGRSFLPHDLVVPAPAIAAQPGGVMFASPSTGIAYFGSGNTAGAYLARTTTAGAAWTNIALPAAIASHSVELRAATFAPDGVHGYLVGFDFTTSQALLLTTADTGATWAVDSDVGPAASDAGGGKLYSVFALDTSHVWVGGTYGLLLRLK